MTATNTFNEIAAFSAAETLGATKLDQLRADVQKLIDNRSLANILIERVAPLASPAATVAFSSIPGGYQDLFLRIRARGSATAERSILQMILNGDSGAYYSYEYNYFYAANLANIAGSGANLFSLGYCPAASSPTYWWGGAKVDIFDYDQTDRAITIGGIVYASSDDANGHRGGHLEGIYDPSGSALAAITSITLSLDSGNFAAGSSFELYGIEEGA